MSLTIDDAVVRYGVREPRTTAVDRVSLQVAPAEVVALLGPSGCGKSSLLRAVAGLEPLDRGRVCWEGADLSDVPVHRRGFGLMFQDGQLFAHRDVAGNIAFGLQMERMPRTQRAQRVRDLLDLVGLPGYQDRAVASLSGGQAQRVSLARSLAPKPRLLLLDEPLSALDRALRERLAADLHHILRRAGTTALYVTHDHDEAFTVADRVAVMMEGRIVQVGTPEELWAAPADAQVAEFLGYRLVTAADGARFGLSPQALRLESGEDGETAEETGGTGTRSGPGPGTSLRDADDVRIRGEVVSVGFARGRTTAVVQIPDWGPQRAVAEGIVPLEPGVPVTVRVDPGGIIRF
ncbi:ABC transporter ATP-binding protein [Pseudactinotalea sp. Z1739]|uniref:ABC transporter ATP-binding protein n=1 Tax=Pseudactinotalea sp. Z1739 TaxID=3413028 RepID=UPI003C7BE24A